MSMSTPPIYDGRSARDEELIMAVRDAFREYTPVRIWGNSVHINAIDGKVILSGVVRTHSAKERASQIALQVNRVTQVDNQLVADDDTELAVATALGSDPRTQPAFPGILVGVVFGLAYLKGSVESQAIKTAASEIALKVPGVNSVESQLQAPAPAPAPAPAKVVTPKPAAPVPAA